jgi:TPR repeat protein
VLRPGRYPGPAPLPPAHTHTHTTARAHKNIRARSRGDTHIRRLRQGKGVAPDLAAAFQWYSKAALQVRSSGTEPKWYRRAVSDAPAHIMHCYTYEGWAFHFVPRAMRPMQGDAIAAFNVGVCYERGEGVERQPALAIEW